MAKIDDVYWLASWEQFKQIKQAAKIDVENGTKALNEILEKLPKTFEMIIRKTGDRLINIIAEEAAVSAQDVLSGDVGNNTLTHYYRIKQRVYPRYVGGRHYQTGNLARSIHVLKVAPFTYAVGTNLIYAAPVAALDRKEVGKNYLERGAELSLTKNLRDFI